MQKSISVKTRFSISKLTKDQYNISIRQPMGKSFFPVAVCSDCKSNHCGSYYSSINNNCVKTTRRRLTRLFSYSQRIFGFNLEKLFQRILEATTTFLLGVCQCVAVIVEASIFIIKTVKVVITAYQLSFAETNSFSFQMQKVSCTSGTTFLELLLIPKFFYPFSYRTYIAEVPHPTI